MIDRTESTIVNYRGGDASRFEASVDPATGAVSLSLQTVETSAALVLSRASLLELHAFLCGVSVDVVLLPEPEPPVEPEAPVDPDPEPPVVDPETEPPVVDPEPVDPPAAPELPDEEP